MFEWERDPTLPPVKYENGNVIDVDTLADDIIARMNQRNFKDYGEYEDVVGGHMDALWPNWMKYFPALNLFSFSRAVRNHIRQKLSIEFSAS